MLGSLGGDVILGILASREAAIVDGDSLQLSRILSDGHPFALRNGNVQGRRLVWAYGVDWAKAGDVARCLRERTRVVSWVNPDKCRGWGCLIYHVVRSNSGSLRLRGEKLGRSVELTILSWFGLYLNLSSSIRNV